MIDLHSIVAFFHKAKWTGLAITHEINRVPGENMISYSTVGKCVRMLVLLTEETDTPIVPNRKVISVLTPASPLCSHRSHFFQSAKLSRRRRYRNQSCIAIWRLPCDGNCGIFRGSLVTWLSLQKWTGCKEQQNLSSFQSQSDTKCGNILSTLTTHGFIERLIGSDSGLQRMIRREQGRDEGSITTKRCWRSFATRITSISSTWCPKGRSTGRGIMSIIS
jgi:hypothetical protein